MYAFKGFIAGDIAGEVVARVEESAVGDTEIFTAGIQSRYVLGGELKIAL